jgi:hypothetical protein
MYTPETYREIITTQYAAKENWKKAISKFCLQSKQSA